MAYQDIATINVSLQTSGVSAIGFGTPLFASAHRYFPERVRAYSTLTAAAVDLPTDSDAYKAVQAFLSNTPSPAIVKIGRREADLDLTVLSGSTTGELTFFANDGVDTFSLTVAITGQVDEDAVATAITAAIEGDADIGPLVVASASTNVVSVDVAASTYTFWIKDLSSNLTESYTTTETAPELMVSMIEEDNDFYFVTTNDHTEAFVLALAADTEAREKIYFFSVAEQAGLTSFNAGSATDILGKIKDFGYLRTKGFFHHLADSAFPECTYAGYNAPFPAGSVTWTNLKVAISPSQNPSNGLVLNATQKGYLEDRNAAYVEPKGGLNLIRNGRVAGGEHIDVIRGRDNLVVDLDTAYTNLLISQQGSKIPFNDEGISTLESVCRSTLNRYVTRNFVNDNFRVIFPPIADVPTADKAARVYQQGTFEAELSGAIEIIKISGVLTLTLS
tara:strand:+ start:1649 stop:2992 length:1344 start_codon:yes stop_codon:yes gene_type:complete